MPFSIDLNFKEAIMWMRFLIGPISAIVFINSFLTSPVFAQSTVSFSPSDRFTLDPSFGNPNQNLGVVHIESDSSSGWSLQLRSQNHGEMHHVSVGATIRYTLEFDGNTISNLSSGNDITVLSTSKSTCLSPGGCDYVVRGRLPAGEVDGKPSGSYSDRLIFTLTNNQ